MKLVTFTNGGEPRVGALSDDETRVVDLAAADDQPYFATMLDVIEAGDTAVGRAKDIVASASGSASFALPDVTLKT
ncbi:MAG: FAA hydrolase family protein, partial [Alphaproteobacteria bacterium]|nr:FAA hydrolase family protein [Alphaproteobacteria bacterium]